MIRMLIRRFLLAIPTVIAVTALLFFLVYALVGSPAALMLGQDASPNAIADLNKKFGFDQPLVVQYWNWLSSALTGDFGRSYATQQSVAGSIAGAFPVTLELTLWSMVLSVLLAIVINTLVRPDTLTRGIVTWLMMLGITIPNFMLGISIIFLFSVTLGILPTSGWIPWSSSAIDHLRHMIAPVLTLSAYYFGVLSIVYRAEFSSIQKQTYLQVARAKGASEGSVAFKHALPNAILPVITYAGVSMGQLLGGAVVTETVFSLPGIGRLFVSSISAQDFPVMLSVGLLIIVAVIIMNVITDIVYMLINPQIRTG